MLGAVDPRHGVATSSALGCRQIACRGTAVRASDATTPPALRRLRRAGEACLSVHAGHRDDRDRGRPGGISGALVAAPVVAVGSTILADLRERADAVKAPAEEAQTVGRKRPLGGPRAAQMGPTPHDARIAAGDNRVDPDRGDDMTEKTEDLKGRTKEAAGDVTGDESLQREGKVEQASSTIKEKVGDGADKAKDLLSRDGDR